MTFVLHNPISRRSLLAACAGSLLLSNSRIASAQDNAQTLAPNGLTARSIFAIDTTANVMMYAQNPDERLPIGSLVKITTALVVVNEIEDLSETVVIDESDLVDITLESNMQLVAGDTLTVSLLLYGLLIPSGNDGAKALARHVGSKISGSDDPDAARAAFVKRMNEYVRELGLVNTNFTNPDGLDPRDTFSSAREIAVLFTELMKVERLRGIVSEPAYQGISSGSEARTYTSTTTNDLLGVSGVIGGKTGTTEDAGGCVVLARELENGNLVIFSVIGADHQYADEASGTPEIDERWTDAAILIDAMDSEITWVAPQDNDAFPGLSDQLSVWQLETRDQADVPQRLGDDQSAYQLIVGTPAEAGSQAGQVVLYYASLPLGVIPVYQAE